MTRYENDTWIEGVTFWATINEHGDMDCGIQWGDRLMPDSLMDAIYDWWQERGPGYASRQAEKDARNAERDADDLACHRARDGE